MSIKWLLRLPSPGITWDHKSNFLQSSFFLFFKIILLESLQYVRVDFYHLLGKKMSMDLFSVHILLQPLTAFTDQWLITYTFNGVIIWHGFQNLSGIYKFPQVYILHFGFPPSIQMSKLLTIQRMADLWLRPRYVVTDSYVFSLNKHWFMKDKL